MPRLDPYPVAALEERRLATSLSEVALEAQQIAGGWMCYSRPGCWSNQAAGLGLEGPVSEEDLEHLVHFYQSRGAVPYVGVSPIADEGLVELLESRGFQLREMHNLYGLGIGRSALTSAPDHASGPQGLEVREARADELETFVAINSAGFGLKADGSSQEHLDEITRRVFAHPRTIPFLAFWEGIPAASGLVETYGELACLIGTSVLPEYRRKGIQLAMMRKRMVSAAESQCRFITVASSPGIATGRNAERLGFGLAYIQSAFTLD